MQSSITTCLSFSKNAEEAIKLCVDIFNKAFGDSKGRSEILKVNKFGEEEVKALADVPDVPKDMIPGPAGSIKTIRFTLLGQELLAVNGGGYFGKFHESMSMYVNCENQKQIDIIYDALAVGGELQPCGWVKDKFGVSWQITPDFLWEMDESENKSKSQAVNMALYKMNKIDLKEIQRVWDEA